MDVPAWLNRLETALAQLRQADLGYPQGDNGVRLASDFEALAKLSESVGLTEQSPLTAFYRSIEQVSLPDVWNGYFIMSPREVIRALQGGAPRRLTGPSTRDIVIFGSDGGGAYFALGAGGGGEVLHLRDCAVHDGVADGETGMIRIVAPDFNRFLERLLADAEAFVRADEEWAYLA